MQWLVREITQKNGGCRVAREQDRDKVSIVTDLRDQDRSNRKGGERGTSVDRLHRGGTGRLRDVLGNAHVALLLDRSDAWWGCPLMPVILNSPWRSPFYPRTLGRGRIVIPARLVAASRTLGRGCPRISAGLPRTVGRSNLYIPIFLPIVDRRFSVDYGGNSLRLGISRA
jgi:hypothetical protein